MSNNIPGEMFTPCFMTEKDYEEAYKKSVFYVEKNYMEEYRKHMAAMQHIANMAKTYILNNWRVVTDWSGLDVKITHGPTGEVTEYYNHDKALQREEERRQYNEEHAKAKGKVFHDDSRFRKMFIEMLKEDASKHNPILEVTDVVLDPTDGDFSITINGDKEHWWIYDEEVIIIADYIEKQMKMNTKKLELLNSEGPILMAERTENGYVIWDQWRKGPLMTLTREELDKFMKGKIEIADSSGKRWNYLNEHEDMRPSHKTVQNFFDGE
jgi:hypothetical protein